MPSPSASVASKSDARKRASVEGARIAQRDLEDAGGALNLEEVRTLLHGGSCQTVDDLVREGSLLAVSRPGKQRAFPTMQFMPDGSPVAGLAAVREALPTDNVWVVLSFLTRPDFRLGSRCPIDVLKDGETSAVVESARRYGEQGA